MYLPPCRKQVLRRRPSCPCRGVPSQNRPPGSAVQFSQRTRPAGRRQSPPVFRFFFSAGPFPASVLHGFRRLAARVFRLGHDHRQSRSQYPHPGWEARHPPWNCGWNPGVSRPRRGRCTSPPCCRGWPPAPGASGRGWNSDPSVQRRRPSARSPPTARRRGWAWAGGHHESACPKRSPGRRI